ncbi:CapA family protein [Paenibacillus chartarius]|uniref:CapA family protein n=1 Tax=Paenibacillus chartarius TaxID=747481 RepID=A0ABV6DUY2_9BACL
MIQSRQERHRGRKKKGGVKWVLLAAALSAGAVVTAASVWLPGVMTEGGTGIAQPPAASGNGGKSAASTGSAAESAGQKGASGSGTANVTGGTAKPSAGKPGTAEAAEGPAQQPESSGDGGAKVRMSFVGDILLADGVEKLMQQYGYSYPYSAMGTLLSDPDLTIANLEAPFTERGTKQTKEYVYRAPPKALPALKAAGIDILNTANNHIMDYGSEGLLDTLSYLDQEGVPHIGTGRNLEEALKPVIVTKQGIRIAFLGFSRVVPNNSWKAGAKNAGVADTYNHVVPVETIKKAKEQADLVVVIAHWGTERKDTPDPVQRDLAHRYIDAGADLIVASHPHVLQGIESYKGKWIAYSLGNFIFTTNDNPRTWETMVLQAECSKSGSCSLKSVPVLTKWAKPEPMLGEDGAKLLERVSKVSFRSRINADGTIVEDASIAGPSLAPPPAIPAIGGQKASGSSTQSAPKPNSAPAPASESNKSDTTKPKNEG